MKMYNDELEYEPQEHDELAIKVFELIKEEVSTKMSETVTSLEYYQKRSTQLQDDLRKVQRENREMQNKHTQELNKALKEREMEIRREMFEGFNVGDTVYIAGCKSLFHDCSTCEKGKVTAKIGEDEFVINCPNCSNGKIHTYTYFPVKDTISTIQLEINKNNKWLHFWLDKDDSKKEYDRIFKTEEECQDRCNALNDKNKTQLK